MPSPKVSRRFVPWPSPPYSSRESRTYPRNLSDQWSQLQSTPWQLRTEPKIRPQKQRTAFKRLIVNQSIYRTHCFCLFLDGLDEYEPAIQEDFSSVVRMLKSWTEDNSDHVKLCVSSREHNVFLNGFSGDNRLRLQDLTRPDMERYIHAELKMPIQDLEKNSIVNNILDRAEGIFLWVRVVVKYLMEQIEDGHGFSDPRKSVQELPLEIEDLFRQVLVSIGTQGPWLRQRAYQIFAMVKKIDDVRKSIDSHHRSSSIYGVLKNSFYYRLPLGSIIFLENYQRDANFAMRGPHTGPGSQISDAKKQLNGLCKGLYWRRIHGHI